MLTGGRMSKNMCIIYFTSENTYFFMISLCNCIPSHIPRQIPLDWAFVCFFGWRQELFFFTHACWSNDLWQPACDKLLTFHCTMMDQLFFSVELSKLFVLLLQHIRQVKEQELSVIRCYLYDSDLLLPYCSVKCHGDSEKGNHGLVLQCSAKWFWRLCNSW